MARAADSWMTLAFEHIEAISSAAVFCLARAPGDMPRILFLALLSGAHVGAVAHAAMSLGIIVVMVYRRGM